MNDKILFSQLPSVKEMKALQKIFGFTAEFKGQLIVEVLEQCIYGTGFYDCKVNEAEHTLYVQEQGTTDKQWYAYPIPTKLGTETVHIFGNPKEGETYETLWQLYQEFGGAEICKDGMLYFT